MYKHLTTKKVNFISGKFDQLHRNVPYRALIQAFEELVRELLTERREDLEHWKEQLLAVLGPSGQIIIDVISDVELIIGSQPPVVDLGPVESQNRFNLVFGNEISRRNYRWLGGAYFFTSTIPSPALVLTTLS
ncbi:MAG: AAA family ATPase [bacterium]|nr:AAA family ATPase [bacterium]